MTKEIMKNNQAAQSRYVLSDADKSFLTAVRRDDEKFAYVLALVCIKNSRIQPLIAREVYIFYSKSQADALYNTAQQMAQLTKQAAPSWFKQFEESIKHFNENER